MTSRQANPHQLDVPTPSPTLHAPGASEIGFQRRPPEQGADPATKLEQLV